MHQKGVGFGKASDAHVCLFCAWLYYNNCERGKGAVRKGEDKKGRERGMWREGARKGEGV